MLAVGGWNAITEAAGACQQAVISRGKWPIRWFENHFKYQIPLPIPQNFASFPVMPFRRKEITPQNGSDTRGKH